MKTRILAAVMAVMMLACAASVTSFAAGKADDCLTVEAYIAQIEVDGVLDEAWKSAASVNIDKVKSNSDMTYYKETMKAGEDYAKATAKVLWDGKATLYILCEVVDKTPNYVADKAWLRDSFDLFFRWDNSKEAGAKKSGQYRITGDGSDTAASKFPAEVGFTKDGWFMEYAITLDAANKAEDYIGLDFQYNDNVLGKGNREVNLGWSDTEDKASSDASVYGQCLLSKKEVGGSASATATTTAPAPAAPAAVWTAATFDANTTYTAKSVISETIHTFEAVFQLDESVSDRAGVIVGNYNKGIPNVSIEIHKNGVPRFYNVDSATVKCTADLQFDQVDVRGEDYVHLAFVVDEAAKQVHCYLNGELKQSKDFGGYTPEATHSPLWVGGDPRDGNKQYFRGSIKSVALYADARSADTIKKDMAGINTADSNLLAAYDLSVGGSARLADISGNGNDLVYFGPAVAEPETTAAPSAGSSAATFDVSVLMALAASAAGAGVVIFRKKR